MHNNKEQFQDLLLRTVLGMVTVALVMAIVLVLAVVPAWAQNAVPPTAREAAASPAFASRLARSSARPSAPESPRRAPSQEQVIYANGPVNGICDINGCAVNAQVVNFGYTVSNSFAVSDATISGFNFAFWYLFSTDNLLTMDWSIGTTAFASDIAQGTASGLSLSDQFLFTNYWGYDIHSIGVSGLDVPVGAGTYWVTLSNAVVDSGNPAYWDENSGPSLAEESALGTIPSESFNVVSGNGPPPPCNSSGSPARHSGQAPASALTPPAMPDRTLEVISWTIPPAYPDAPPTLDKAGNLYGTTSLGGAFSAGTVYRLSPHGTGWVLSLYSFPGGAGGAGPSNPVTIGQDGSVYGTAGDIVFKLILPTPVCPTALCPMTMTVLYRFLGGSDGANPTGALVFDGAGNIYGMTAAGGAYGKGTVYQLSPTDSGWVETVLYSFGGSGDGANPAGSVILNQSGNLYGAANGGGSHGCGTIFQLTPSAPGWLEKTIYDFTGADDGRYPVGVVADASGNLYGLAQIAHTGTAFLLSPSQDNWAYSSIYSYDTLWAGDSLTIDTNANLYVSVPLGLSGSYGYVFELAPSGGDWIYTDLHDFSDGNGALPMGSTVDPKGNVYGAARAGIGNNAGFVFQITP